MVQSEINSYRHFFTFAVHPSFLIWLSKDSWVTNGVTLSVHPSPFWYSLEQMFPDCDNGSLPGHWRQVPRPRLSVSSSVTNYDPCQSQIVITVIIVRGRVCHVISGPGDSLLVTATFYHDIKTDWAPIKSITHLSRHHLPHTTRRIVLGSICPMRLS